MKKILLTLIVLTSFVFNEVMAETSHSKITETMSECISTLGPGTSFAYADLGVTDEEISLIDQIQPDFSNSDYPSHYDRFGDLHLLNDELPFFLSKVLNNNEDVIQAVAGIISRTVSHVTKASNKNSAWVTIRISPPHFGFDLPRWHIDGHYFGPYPYPGLVFKFAAVLKGNPTLLYNLPEHMRDIFISNMNNRQLMSELLDINKAESPKKGEGVFFVVGNDKIGAVHSEPKMKESRLFFSILPGDESEINELYLKWHPGE